MDKVLTRKLFATRYFQMHKPKKFNKGGITVIQKFNVGGLSSQEKALYAATLAAPLLKGTQAAGESAITGTLRAFGEGLEKIPATALAIAKAAPKGKSTIRQATSAEKQMLGRNVADRIVVKVDAAGNLEGIVDKPTAGEMEKTAKREGALTSAARIYGMLGPDKSKYPTGPVKGRIGRISAYFGLNPEVARLDVELENFRKDAIQALRGAQVGPAEEASFNAVLPALTDPPEIIKAKMDTAIAKLKALDDRLSADGTVGTQYTAEDIVREYGQDLTKFGIDVEEIIYDPKLKTYNFVDDQLTVVGQ